MTKLADLITKTLQRVNGDGKKSTIPRRQRLGADGRPRKRKKRGGSGGRLVSLPAI